MKPKVAFFDFASCEGCQLTVLNCEDELLDLFSKIVVVNFREAASTPREEYFDIAFVEGSIGKKHDIERILNIRKNAKILIALGSCAHIGCVNIFKNRFQEEENRKVVYGDECYWDTIEAKPISHYVKVDYAIPGCPINKYEFLNFVKDILRGLTPNLPDYSVCEECKLRENGCLLLKGRECIGSVSRAGCGAICPTYGSVCWGCRGTYPDANFEGLRYAMKKAGFSDEYIDEVIYIFRFQK
ncbi:MAG: NADH:ubiquinone oxidoreductase [bacterium]|nr:NADH:ubiquinone oxidoreductase [bacterium]